MSNQRYMMRGVSASKEDVHNAIKNIDKGIFPQAFCKIIPDILGGDPEYCNIMHADGAGTKSSLAYLYWRETGDLSVWKGIAQDALIMNIDDLLCVGAVDNILVSSTIGRNKLLVPGEVISAIINGTDELLAELREMGVGVYATGGETADVGDLVRTIIVDSTVTCRMKRSDVINNANIRPGDVIVGLASYGQATYEKEYNGGMPAEADRQGRRQPAGCRQARPLAHPYLCAGCQEAARRPAPPDPWHGTLLGRRTDQGAALRGRQLPRHQGQPLSRTSPVPHHQGAERHGLGGDVQGIQHGTPSGSLPFARACRGSHRHLEVVQHRRTGHRPHRGKRQEGADHPLGVR